MFTAIKNDIRKVVKTFLLFLLNDEGVDDPAVGKNADDAHGYANWTIRPKPQPKKNKTGVRKVRWNEIKILAIKLYCKLVV